MAVIECTSCAKRYKVRSEVVGSTVKCKSCGTKFAARDVEAGAGGSPDILSMAGLGGESSSGSSPDLFSQGPATYDTAPSGGASGYTPPPPPMTMYQPPKGGRSKSSDEMSGATIVLRLTVAGLILGLLYFSGHMGWTLLGSSSMIPNNSSAKRATGTPVTMDLATLVTQGPGNNRYVELTGWALADDGFLSMYEETKITKKVTVDWTYQALVIPGHKTPVAILRSTVWKSDEAIAKALARPSLSGYVVGRGALGTKEINQLSSNDREHVTKHAADLWVIDVGREIPALGVMTPSPSHAHYASAVGADTSATDRARASLIGDVSGGFSASSNLSHTSERLAELQARDGQRLVDREARRASQQSSTPTPSQSPPPAPPRNEWDLTGTLAGTPWKGPHPASIAPNTSPADAALLDPSRYVVVGGFYMGVLGGFEAVNQELDKVRKVASFRVVPQGISDPNAARSYINVTLDGVVNQSMKFPSLFGKPDGVVEINGRIPYGLIVRPVSDIREVRVNGLPFLRGETPAAVSQAKGSHDITYTGFDGPVRLIIDVVSTGPDDAALPALEAMAKSFRRASQAEAATYANALNEAQRAQARAKIKALLETIVEGAARYHIDVPGMYELSATEAFESQDSLYLVWRRNGQPADEPADIMMQIALKGKNDHSAVPRVITDSTEQVQEWHGRVVRAYGGKTRSTTLGGIRGVAVEFERTPGDDYQSAAFAAFEEQWFVLVTARWKANNDPQRRAMQAVLNSFRKSSRFEAAAIKPTAEGAMNAYLAEKAKASSASP